MQVKQIHAHLPNMYKKQIHAPGTEVSDTTHLPLFVEGKCYNIGL